MYLGVPPTDPRTWVKIAAVGEISGTSRAAQAIDLPSEFDSFRLKPQEYKDLQRLAKTVAPSG